MAKFNFFLVLIIFLATASIFPLWAGGSTEQRSSANSASRSTAPVNPTVVYVVGQSLINNQEAEPGQVIRNGDRIDVRAGGLLEITFSGANAIRISENTRLVLNLDGLQKSIVIERGSVAGVVKQLEKLSGGGLTIRTPTVSGGVRGTSFFTDVGVEGGEEGTYFCTCNGAIELAAPGNNPFTDRNAQHGAYLFSRTQNTDEIIVLESKLQRHDNDTLESLAKLISVGIDWNSIDE